MEGVYYLGIDPGKSGAFALIDSRGNISEKHVMPVVKAKGSKSVYDVQRIASLLQGLLEDRKVKVILEKTQPFPGTGAVTCWSLGYCEGMIEALLVSNKVPYQLVRPNIWQKKVLAGFNTKDTKQASYLYCARTWPTEDWRATDRSKKPHDGLTDAAAIAMYGI